MTKLIVLFIIGQLLVIVLARPVPPLDGYQVDEFDPFGAIEDPFMKRDIYNHVILPKWFEDISIRSGPEYGDSSSSFDVYNDLVYGPDFLLNNAPFFPGIGNPFGPVFPFAADASFDRFHQPTINQPWMKPYRELVESLEDFESYYGDGSRDLVDYFGGLFGSKGDAGVFDGNLASFFSKIYDGPLFHTEDIMAI